jgi:hypothetical protein
MTAIHKKLAVAKHEDGAVLTTHSCSKHGLSKATQKMRRYYRKAAARDAARVEKKNV